MLVGLLLIAAGAALVTIGALLTFGPVALIVCGVLAVAAGVLVPWELLP